MKVIVINSSPNMDKGNTAKILKPFVEGMEEVGAEVEIFYTKKLNINPCTGEFHCWRKDPGKCYQDDDMQMLISKFKESEIWVFATPLYIFHMSGPMKMLVDRLIPMYDPFKQMKGKHIRHIMREDVKAGKIVLVSSEGWWNKDNFDNLVNYFKLYGEELNREFSGALLRPHSHAIPSLREAGVPVDDVFEAAKEAGRQIVKEGKFSQKTLDTVSRDLLPFEGYLNGIRQAYNVKL